MSDDLDPPIGGRTVALRRALTFARRSHPSLTLTELMALTVVAEHEGLTVTSLARICDHTVATASRTLYGLAAEGTPGALPPARGLLQLMRGPSDNRSRHAFLTVEGETFCNQIEMILSQAAPRIDAPEASALQS